VIYDAFLYNGEDTMLELRLGVIGDVVDRIVIGEATTTFSGKPKPLTFNAKDSRFAPYARQIDHVVIGDTPDSGADRWARERFQRDALLRGLRNCRADDLVIISDVDEIPDPYALKCGERGGYRSQISNYWLNTIEEGPVWIGPAVGYAFEVLGPGPETRRARRYGYNRVERGGWHFAYAMTEAQIVQKLQSFAHAEYDSPEWHAKILQARKDLKSFVTGNTMKVVDIDKGYFPQFLRDHRDRFQNLLFGTPGA